MRSGEAHLNKNDFNNYAADDDDDDDDDDKDIDRHNAPDIIQN